MTMRSGWTAAVLALALCLGVQAQQNEPANQNTTQQADQVSLTGTVRAIELQERGRTGQGIHLRLRTEEDRDLDVHLGPQAAVGKLIQGLTVGQQVTVEAFRDDRLPEGQYVARSLAWDGQEVELRDANLRPVWAGQQAGQQAGQRPRHGMMQGRGMGPGRMGGGPAADGDRPMQPQMQDWLEQMQAASERLDELVQTMNEAEGEARVQAIADVVNELVAQHQAMMQRHQQMMQRMMERGPGRGMGPGMMQESPPTQPQDSADPS